jgi:hypothetical protein
MSTSTFNDGGGVCELGADAEAVPRKLEEELASRWLYLVYLYEPRMRATSERIFHT